MDPDSMADASDESDATYQAFDSSGEAASPRRRPESPSRTEFQAETPARRGPEGFGGSARWTAEGFDSNASAPDAFRSSDDVIPVDSQGNFFGKYRVLSKVGGGGMGHIWLVEHVRLKRQSALKVMKSELADNADNLLRFQREAEILAQLSRHPNAVPVHDADIVGKFAYIEMDYLPGQNLKQRLDDAGLMTLHDVAWFLDEACAVLGEAHARAIVHRDIKPTNVMIVPDPSAPRGERVKVLDFGIAKIIRDAALDTASMSLQTEGFLGTYPYSSPEQLGLPLPGRREPAPVDLRSDIYSLGVLLYEMLVGTRPFSGLPTKLLYDHVHTPPPPFSELAPEVHIPAEVEAIVRRCLEKDPGDRFQSVDDLLRAFRAAVEATEAAVEVTHGSGATTPIPRAPASTARRPAAVELEAAAAPGSATRARRGPRPG
ncbi:MAG: serine/threonine-protein kinase, partial [Isosphaeraceae bacterium]